jgi:hypothetical protein
MSGQWYNTNAMPQNFDWQRYVGANKDLGVAGIDTEAEAERHYFNYGQKENRSIGALAPTKLEDLSSEDYRAGVAAYRQATGDDSVLTGVNGEVGSEYAPVNAWIQQNYIPQGKFVTDYSAAKPADTFQYLNTLETSNRPVDQLASIAAAWNANKDDPGKVRQLISGSTGLDSHEWGVTLFAHDLFQIKSIVYEMRFDEVTTQYGEFGDFYIGIQTPTGELLQRVMLA